MENKEVKIDLPKLHSSQEVLGQRMHDIDRDVNAPIMVAPPGKGKTRAMSHYLDLVEEDGVVRLTIIVTADVNAARKQAIEFGALANAYQKNTHADRIKRILENNKSVRTVMSPPMFYKLPFGIPPVNNEKHEPLGYFANEFLPNVIGGACQEITFVFDEIHTIQKKPGLPEAFEKMSAYAETQGLTIYCCGLTATPEEELPSEKLMGFPALTVEYTEDELGSFNKELCVQPVVPDWTTIDLPSPVGKEEHKTDLYHLKVIVLGGMVVTQEDLKADEQAIGCHWMKVHSVPQGDELPFNQGLCDALSGGQTKFTLEKLASFGLPKLPTVFTWLVFLLMPETGLLFLPLGYFTIST